MEIYCTFGQVPVFDDGVDTCRGKSTSIELTCGGVDDFLASNPRPFLPSPSFDRAPDDGWAG